ncbi:MAG: hypothetical protein EZS28_029762 [Streblomastix strix]|uniref:Uncharacterized protein n=1 Tax=Streblomastix strix TaxID=222440 RepID=A0A5J4UWM9_9EUKA|nr:MAG: hypothetical protein EZS28_029762 [Streblomastix strix]
MLDHVRDIIRISETIYDAVTYAQALWINAFRYVFSIVCMKIGCRLLKITHFQIKGLQLFNQREPIDLKMNDLELAANFFLPYYQYKIAL